MALVYRVIRQKYADRPLDVMGTWLNGGRWNPPGAGILYTAEHPALALVEILVHMPQVPFWHFPQGMQLGFGGRIRILSGHLRTKINVRF